MVDTGILAGTESTSMVPLVRPGVSTHDLDLAVREMTLVAGAVPATLGYRG